MNCMEDVTIRENIKAVEKTIAVTCREVGRDVQEVTLIAVSKTKPVEMLQEHMRMDVEILVKIKYKS